MFGQLLGLSYGMGVDSTAIMVGLHQRGIRPDFILFADVGSEKAATYAYKPIIDAWLEKVGFPPITTVRRVPPIAPYRNIEQNFTMNCTLAPPAFNARHSCTMAWKIMPMKKWSQQDRATLESWSNHVPVVKLIGYDASEGKRKKKNAYKETETHRYTNVYPLIDDWGWDRMECEARIAEAGLPVPVKSSCFFCPNMKAQEIRDITPVERGRIMRMEVYAEPFNKKTAGNWRDKMMTSFILDEGLEWIWPEDEVPVNPNCKHERLGHSCNPPHIEGSARVLIEATGFKIPKRTVGWDQLADDSHDQLVLTL